MIRSGESYRIVQGGPRFVGARSCRTDRERQGRLPIGDRPSAIGARPGLSCARAKQKKEGLPGSRGQADGGGLQNLIGAFSHAAVHRRP